MVKVQVDGYMLWMKKYYEEVVCLKLIEEFGYKNFMEVLVIEKIVFNMGVGELIVDLKKVMVVVGDFVFIVGQKLVIIKVCKVILQFKVCENMLIGVKVMLCKVCMYEFFDCFVIIVFLCVCDFWGLNFKLFDGCGNYVMGIKEYLVFFEINYDRVEQVWGMDVIIIIMVKIDDEVCVLLCYFNFLFWQ